MYANDKKTVALAVCIVLLMATSWIGSLDEYSEESTNSSIIQAGTAYAIVRGINAIVSVLQSSTFEGGAVFATFSISLGEVLDPVNDLIERFSTVMSFALASLVLQKILLAITSNALFKVLISLLGVLTLVSIVLANTVYRLWMLRSFLVLIFLRFSLVIVVVLNAQVDRFFLSDQIDQGSQSLSQMKSEMSTLETNAKLAEKNEGLRNKVDATRKSIKTIESKLLPPLKLKLIEVEAAIFEEKNEVKKQSQYKKWNPLDKISEVMLAENELKTAKTKKAEIETAIANHEKDIKAFKQSIASDLKTLSGDDGEGVSGLLKSARNTVDNLSFSNIESLASNYVKSVIDLIVLFMLKTVFIPILFLYGLIKITKKIWADMA